MNFISNIANYIYFFFPGVQSPKGLGEIPNHYNTRPSFYLWHHGIIALPRGNSRQILLPTHLRGQEFFWPHQLTPPSVPLDFPLFKWGLSWWGFEQDEADLRHLHRPGSAPSFLSFLCKCHWRWDPRWVVSSAVPIWNDRAFLSHFLLVLGNFSLVHLCNDWINSGSAFHMNYFIFFLWNCHTFRPSSSLSTTFP